MIKYILRQATEKDIYQGKIIYHLADWGIYYRAVIELVLNPTDRWKAFCADTGCRYGLENTFVVKYKILEMFLPSKLS